MPMIKAVQMVEVSFVEEGIAPAVKAKISGHSSY